MKNLTAYSLILLLLLNVMGYYGVFMGMKYQHSADLRERFDESNYASLPTVSVKVPLTIAYYGDTKYERINGEIEYQGEVYRLVRQKYEKDTLYIECIRDIKGKAIKQALADYVKNFSDHSADAGAKTLPSFIKDFISSSFTIGSSARGWHHVIQFGLTEQLFNSISPSQNSPPPEASSEYNS